MLNVINRFGVKQRCMKDTEYLTDLFLTAVHYERDVNFYIYENDFRYLATINREILHCLNIPSEIGRVLTLGELCRNVSGNLDRDVLYWDSNENLAALLEENFVKKFSFSDEMAVVEKGNKKLIGIFNRRDSFHEFYSISTENEAEMLCYRELSHYYKPCRSGYITYAENINSQHGEDGILSAVFDRIGTTSKYAVEFGGWDGIYLSNIRHLITDRGW